MCRICILIKEMLERVESLDILDTLDSTGRYWFVLEGAGMCSNASRVGMSGMTGMSGMSL